MAHLPISAPRCFTSPTHAFSFGDSSSLFPEFRTTLELDTARLRPKVWRAYLFTIRPERPHLDTLEAEWAPKGDSVVVSWYDPFVTADWHLRLSGGRIAGWAMGSTDQLIQQRDGSFAPAGYLHPIVARDT